MKGKKGVTMGMPFNWIFAILVGGFILFLAVFGAGKFIRTSEQTVYTETAASLVSLFDPLETGLASGKSSEIVFKKESRIRLDCDESGLFGRQRISFSEETLGDEFGEGGQRITIKDKYVFSDNVLEGKAMYYFSKPYFAGFKVADLLMMYSNNQLYCVHDASAGFREDVEGLNLKNIIFMNQSVECEGIEVCFNQGRCDINVFENNNLILKDGEKLYYVDDLIYAAIFSSPEIYECNVKRIKKRFNELGRIYLDKINVIKRVNCDAKLGDKLALLVNSNFTSSKNLIELRDRMEEVDTINQRAQDGCRVYYNLNWER
ncbi:hypothetical protein CMI42_05060 [Candidatus Pacearchaeota archaeon]|nr:hypothetical protein [Candidatus Pacearchaeota archaeon]|tara:strand:- start:456 stop:1409 length:954 start_codon:yes stop_codon:yes gene_type:complete